MKTEEMREKIANAFLEGMPNKKTGLYDVKSTIDAISSSVIMDMIAMLQYLKSKQFHGSHCIDDECDNEQHGYDAVHIDDVDDMLDSLNPNTKKEE